MQGGDAGQIGHYICRYRYIKTDSFYASRPIVDLANDPGTLLLQPYAKTRPFATSFTRPRISFCCMSQIATNLPYQTGPTYLPNDFMEGFTSLLYKPSYCRALGLDLSG